MRKLMFILALCLFITSYSMAGPGDEITGVSVDSFSTQYNTNVAPLGTINEDGFDSVTYTHNGTFNDFWCSANATVAAQYVTYDLGAEYEIGKIDIWNYNGGSLGRCIKDVNVAISTDGTSFTVVESIIVPQGVALGEEEPVHTFYVNPKATARYVKIDVQTNYGDPDFVGFAEIKFFEYVPGEITGVVIDDHSGNADAAIPINTINELGFDSDTYTHDATFDNLWCSDGGGTVADQYVTYDLGALYDLGKIDIWNYCGNGTRSIKVVDVNVSPDGVNWTVAETLDVYVGRVSAPEPVQTFFVDPHVVVRYVQIDVQTSWGDPNYVGFGEIKFFEYSYNFAPTVIAGADQEVILPADAVMDATVSDVDGDPLTLLWTKVSGPGTVSFDDDSIEDPTVTFSAAGYYQLQLSANDGVNPAVTNSLYVRVMPAGWSYIDGVEAIEQSTYIAGREMGKTVDESGLNAGVLGSHSGGNSYGDNWHSDNPATVDDQYLIWDLGGPYDLDGIRVWTCNALIAMGVKDCDMLVSTNGGTYTGIGAFSFLQAPGTTDTDYSEVSMVTPVLCRFVKMDINTNWGQPNFTGLSEIKFSGTLINAAPIVDAGNGAEVIYPADADITDATASDPDADTITYLWTKVSGPGNVTFDTDDVIDPTVSFDAAGAYVLQLEVTDSYGQVVTDTMPVRVLPSWWVTVDDVTAEDVSSTIATRPLAKTIDESGLNKNGMGTHSGIHDDHWNSENPAVGPQHCVWDLGDDYLINGIRIWNSNQAGYTTIGVQNCNILISADGVTYTDLGALTLVQGPGDDTVDYSEVIALDAGGSLARYIKMNISSNYGNAIVGLAEIKFSGYLNGCSSKLAGDLDNDCDVDVNDLGMMAGKWLNCMDPAGDCYKPWTSEP